jgi:hypothetical protein
MKKRAEDLTKELDENEKEYQVGKKLHITFNQIVLTYNLLIFLTLGY